MLATRVTPPSTRTLSRAEASAALIGPLHAGGEFPQFTKIRSFGTILRANHVALRCSVYVFFAHWQPQSLDMLAAMRPIRRKYRDAGVQFVGVTMFFGLAGRNPTASVDFEFATLMSEFKRRAIDWPVAFVHRKVLSTYGIDTLPTVVVVDTKGTVRELISGVTPASNPTIERAIQRSSFGLKMSAD